MITLESISKTCLHQEGEEPVKIEIHYCAQWNYKPEAVGLAAELKENFGVETELFAEGKGIFDVVVDGDIIYSKYKTGRFPEPDEVTTILNQPK